MRLRISASVSGSGAGSSSVSRIHDSSASSCPKYDVCLPARCFDGAIACATACDSERAKDESPAKGQRMSRLPNHNRHQLISSRPKNSFLEVSCYACMAEVTGLIDSLTGRCADSIAFWQEGAGPEIAMVSCAGPRCACAEGSSSSGKMAARCAKLRKGVRKCACMCSRACVHGRVHA